MLLVEISLKFNSTSKTRNVVSVVNMFLCFENFFAAKMSIEKSSFIKLNHKKNVEQFFMTAGKSPCSTFAVCRKFFQAAVREVKTLLEKHWSEDTYEQ